MSQRDGLQPTSRSATHDYAPLHHSAAGEGWLSTCHLQLGIWLGMTGEECRYKQVLIMYGRQVGSNQGQQMLGRHGSPTPYARLLPARCGVPAWPRFIITAIIRGASAFTPQQWAAEFSHYKEDIVLYAGARAEQSTTTRSFVNRGWRPAAGVNLLGELSVTMVFHLWAGNTDIISTNVIKMLEMKLCKTNMVRR